MSFEIVLRREAQIDLDEIFAWYEGQQVSLGFLFLEDFENTIDKINRNPFHATIIHGDARSASLKRFPYEVIYRIDDAKKHIRIIAIIHQHRDPSWFRRRLME